MKKNLSKILSFALVLAIVGCMIPAYAAESSGITLTYTAELDAYAHGASLETVSYADTNGFWKYLDKSGTITVTRNTTNGLLALPNAGAWWAMEMYVPKAGEYDVKFNRTLASDGGVAFIYFGAASLGVSEILKSAKVGDIEFYAATTTKGVSDSIGKINVSAPGNYIMVFKCPTTAEQTDAGYTFTKRRQYFKSVILDGGSSSSAVPVSASISVSGNTASVSGPVYMSDGTSTALDDSFDITYESSDTDVAEINASTGVITEKKNGTVTISAKVAKNGGYANPSCEYQVSGAVPQDVEIKALYSMEISSVAAGDDMESVTYADTNGFWKFSSKSDIPVQRNAQNGTLVLANGGTWWAIEMYVPKAGEYDVKFNRTLTSNGGVAFVHFGKASLGVSAILKTPKIGDIVFYDTATTRGISDSIGTVSVPAPGKYLMVMRCPTSTEQTDAGYTFTTRRQYIKQIILEAGADVAPMSVGFSINDGTASVSGPVYMSDGTSTALDDSFEVTYESTKPAVAEVDSETGVITEKKNGTVYISAKVAKNGGYANPSQKLQISSFPAEKPGVTTDSEVSIYVGAETGGTVSATGCTANIVDEITAGTSVTVSAIPSSGYKFAYWKNSSGVAISDEDSYTFTANSNTAIIAVFDADEADGATTAALEFWNGNGEFISKKNVTKGAAFGDEKIAAPSITGYVFDAWSVGDEEIINKLTRAVALFKESDAGYTVSVNGLPVATDKKYGESVTITSYDETFACWMIGDDIVSYNNTFTFYVWGDVDFTEVTGGEEKAIPSVAIAKENGVNYICYNVPDGFTKVEAGLIFSKSGTPDLSSCYAKAIAKESGSYGQFTAFPNDDESIARGYLIFEINETGETRVIYTK